MPPDDDDDGSDGGDENEGKNNKKGHSVPIASYPIRQMMDLIESIAAKQIEVDEIDWALWCNRLEQTLGQACDSAPVKYFRDALRLNPLRMVFKTPVKPEWRERCAAGTMAS